MALASSSSAEITLHHHSAAHAAHATAKSASKEIIIIIESHAEASERIMGFPSASLFPAAVHSATHHSSAKWVLAETSTAKAASEEIILIIKEACEWILATEELLKYLIGTLHIKVVVLEAAASSESTSTSVGGSASLEELAAILIVV